MWSDIQYDVCSIALLADDVHEVACKLQCANVSNFNCAVVAADCNA